MLLIPFVALLSVGFGTFLLGHFFGYHGIASIGAVLIIGVGGAVALTDLQVQTGQTVHNEYETVDGETVVSNQTVEHQYRTVAPVRELGGGTGPLSIGGLVMIVGGLLMSQHLSEVTFS